MKRFSRVMTLALVVIMVFSMNAMAAYTPRNMGWNNGKETVYTPGKNESPFKADAWFQNAVGKQVGIEWYENPTGNTSRGTFVMALWRMLNESNVREGYRELEVSGSYLNQFYDGGSVDPSAYGAVGYLVANGIINGRVVTGNDGKQYKILDFDSSITRAEVAAILYRVCSNSYTFTFQQQNYGAPTFTDTASYAWASDPITFVWRYGIMIGNNYNQFNPGNNLTNEEAVMLLYNMLNSSNGNIQLIDFCNSLMKTFYVTVPYCSRDLNTDAAKVVVDKGDYYEVNVYAPSNKTITVKSEKTSIATVTKTGNKGEYVVKIKGVKVGETTITVKLTNTKSSDPDTSIQIDVSVRNPNDSGNGGGNNNNWQDYPDGLNVWEDDIYLEVGDTYDVDAAVYPSNVYYDSIYYYSSNTSIFTVNSNGRITAQREGHAQLKVYTENNYYEWIDVYVNDNGYYPDPDPDTTEAEIYCYLDGTRYDLKDEGYVNITVNEGTATRIDFYVVSEYEPSIDVSPEYIDNNGNVIGGYGDAHFYGQEYFGKSTRPEYQGNNVWHFYADFIYATGCTSSTDPSVTTLTVGPYTIYCNAYKN